MLHLKKFVSLTKKFIADKKANIIILYGFSILPIMGIVGLSIDYSRIQDTERLVQDASDGLSTYLAQYVAKYGNNVDLLKVANEFLDAQYIKTAKADSPFKKNTTKPNIVDISFTDPIKKDAVAVKLGGNTKLIFNAFYASLSEDTKTQFDIYRDSVAAVPIIKDTEISFVLDITGSMNIIAKNGKSRIQNLKEAVNTFIDTLKKEKTYRVEKVRIAVTPFATGTNFESELKNFNDFYLDWKADKNGNKRQKYKFFFQNRFVSDAYGFYGRLNDIITTNKSLPPLLPFQTDLTKVKDYVDTFKANGSTQTPIAVHVGGDLLNPNSIYKGAAPYNATKKILIIVSDGEMNYGPTIDNDYKYICDDLKKDDKIEIYGISVDQKTNNPLEKYCATSKDHFINTDSSELATEFMNIAKAVSKVAIVK